MRRSWIFVGGILAVSCSGSPKVTYTLDQTEWVIPDQKGSPAFWGGSTQTTVSGLAPKWTENHKPIYVSGAVQYPHMGSALQNRYTTWLGPKPAKFDWVEKGWWRMKPLHGYEEKLVLGYDAGNHLVSQQKIPTGAEAGSGQMYRLQPTTFKPSPGWRVVSRIKEKRKVKITFPNPAAAGGGIYYEVDRTEIDLWAAEIRQFEKYIVTFDDAWDSPHSEWAIPKPKGSEKQIREATWTIRMDPILWIEVNKVVLVHDKTGERKTVEQPTGWAIGAGRFHRDGLSR